MELWQKNLGRQTEVNPDNNGAYEGVVRLQNKVVYCASRIQKGCVGERPIWGLLLKRLYNFPQAVVQLLRTADKMCITKLYMQAHLNFFFVKCYSATQDVPLVFKIRTCTSANMLMTQKPP